MLHVDVARRDSQPPPLAGDAPTTCAQRTALVTWGLPERNVHRSLHVGLTACTGHHSNGLHPTIEQQEWSAAAVQYSNIH